MNTNLEELLANASQKQKELLISPETSRTVASIAHANKIKDEYVPALHTEIALLILGANDIDKDAANIRLSLISSGVEESVVSQLLADIRKYIISKLNTAPNTENKTLTPLSSGAEVKFVPKTITPSTANAVPLIRSNDQTEAVNTAATKDIDLDPYREGMV